MKRILAKIILFVLIFNTNLSIAFSETWMPKVDNEFINNSVGKFFQHTDSDKIIGGEPNCVSAALRAGGFLPAFLLKGTTDFYENELPNCFRKLNESEGIERGDIGIFLWNSELAHAVVFISPDKVFEKYSPNDKDPFVITDKIALLARARSKLEVWRYNSNSICHFERIHKYFNSLSPKSILRISAKTIEDRITSGDWQKKSTLLSKAAIRKVIRKHESMFYTDLRKRTNNLQNPYIEFDKYRKEAIFYNPYKDPGFHLFEFNMGLLGNALQLPILK